MTPTQDATALLPCPFCGGRANIYENEVDFIPKWSVGCGDCAANLDVCEDEKHEAVQIWNTRSTPSASAGPQAEARDIATAAIEIANSVRYAAQLMHDGRTDGDPEKLRWLHHSWGADEVCSKLDDWRDTLSAHPQPQQADGRRTVSSRAQERNTPTASSPGASTPAQRPGE